MIWETLLCLGDSITIGSRTYLGYPEYTGHLLQSSIGNSWNVLNVAVSGFTAVNLLRKVTAEGNHIGGYDPSFFSILVGTNDLKRTTAPDDFAIAYDLLVQKVVLLSKHRNGVLLTIPRLGQGVKYPYTLSMNDQLIQYNEVISCVGKKYGIPVLDLIIEDGEYVDGVHLNSEGCKRVANQLAHFILAQRGLPVT